MKHIIFIILILTLFQLNFSHAQEKPEVFVQLGHSDLIDSLTLLHSGEYLVSQSKNLIKLSNIKLRKEVRSKTFDYEIKSIAISKNGNYLAFLDDKQNILILDFATWKIIKQLHFTEGILHQILFLPDNRYVVSLGTDYIFCWDIVKGVVVWKLRLSDCYGFHRKAVLSKNGEKIIVGLEEDGGAVRVFSIKNKKLILKSKFSSDYRVIRDIALSPDEKYIAITAAKDKIELKEGDVKIFILDIKNGKILAELPIDESYGKNLLSFSPNGKYLVAGGRDIRIFDTHNFKEIKRINKFPPVLFYSDNKILVTNTDYEIEVYDIWKDEFTKLLPVNVLGTIYANEINNKLVTVGKGVYEWDYNSLSRNIIFFSKYTNGENVEIKTISNDRKYGVFTVTVGDGKAGKNFIRLWNLEKNEFVHDYPVIGDDIWSLKFSPDKKYLIAGTANGEIMAYNLENYSNIQKYEGKHLPSSKDDRTLLWISEEKIAFSDDNKYLFSAVPSIIRSEIIKWDIKSGKAVKNFYLNTYISFLQISRDNKNFFIGDLEGNVSVWDVNTGEKKFILNSKNKGVLSCGILSPDNKIIAVGDHNGNIKIWEIATRRENFILKGNNGIVRSIQFSPDGKRIYSTYADGTTRLWDISTGKEIAQFNSFTDGEWIVLTPEGYYNASPNGDKYLNVRIGNNVYGIENYREAFFRPDLVKLALAGQSLKDHKSIANVAQPPVVEIVDTPKEVSFDEIRLTLKLTDQGGGIGDVRLYLNETAILLDSARGIKITPKLDEKTVYKTYAIKLLSGENIIKAVAFNQEGSMASNPAIHKVVSLAKAIRKPAMYAVLIGINEYKNPKLELKYAVADAKAFAEAIKQVATPLFEKVNIKLLTTKEQTTKENIKKTLESLKTLNPEDVFVFYVASHGTVDEGEYFLITSNVGSLSTMRLKEDALTQAELKELIASVPSTKKFIVIDTCNAGKLGEALQVAMLTRGMSEETAMKILSHAVGSTIISASTSLQEALEGYQGHGLFTYVLVEGLKGKADLDKDGFIKTLELANYVDSQVPALAEKVFKRAQYPTATPSGQSFPVGKVR